MSEFIKQSRQHTIDPIKSKADLDRITDYLRAQNRLRDHFLFVLGVSCGLRCGDLVKLRVGNLVDHEGKYRNEVSIQEEKTSKYKKFSVDPAVKMAGDLWNLRDRDRYDYVFKPDGNRVARDENGKIKPLTVRSVEKMLKETIMRELKMPYHVATHTLRKTYAYQGLQYFGNNDRALHILQSMLNHGNINTTLHYIGKTDEDIAAFHSRAKLFETLEDMYNSGEMDAAEIMEAIEATPPEKPTLYSNSTRH
jgi:integrase